MRESTGIDSIVEAVEAGASRREVAELYGISPSVVVIWMQREALKLSRVVAAPRRLMYIPSFCSP